MSTEEVDTKTIGDVDESIEPYMVEDSKFIGFDNEEEQDEVYEWVVDAMKRDLPLGESYTPRVLEVGCQRGDLYVYIKGNVDVEYLGIEPNFFKVQAGYRRNPELKENKLVLNKYFDDFYLQNFVPDEEEDLEDLDFPKFDGIYLVNVDLTEYLDPEVDNYSNFKMNTLKDVFAFKLKNMVKVGGHITFVVPKVDISRTLHTIDFFMMSFGTFGIDNFLIDDNYTPVSDQHGAFTMITIYNR